MAVQHNMQAQAAEEAKIVDYDQLRTFSIRYEDVRVGKANAPVREELGNAIKMAVRFDMKRKQYLAATRKDLFDPISDRRLLELVAELTEEDVTSLNSEVKRLARAAADKVCWLSVISQKMTGEGFLQVYVNRNDTVECQMLLDEFLMDESRYAGIYVQ